VTVDGADDPRVDQFFTKYVQGPQTPEPVGLLAPAAGGLGVLLLAAAVVLWRGSRGPRRTW
ncbi:hypothetical protein AB0C77_38410, partial [Streptomyces sp. NPDC048629]